MFRETGSKATTCRSSLLPEEHPVRPMMHRLRQFISRRAGLVFFLAFAFPASLCAQGSWTFLGPLNVAARVTMIAADPRSDSVLYVVTPGGGISKTSDGGLSWTAITD